MTCLTPTRLQNELAGFFVDRVLVVPTAELLHFDAFAIVDARFHRDVVPAFALFARQGDFEALVGCFRCHSSARLLFAGPDRKHHLWARRDSVERSVDNSRRAHDPISQPDHATEQRTNT